MAGAAFAGAFEAAPGTFDFAASAFGLAAGAAVLAAVVVGLFGAAAAAVAVLLKPAGAVFFTPALALEREDMEGGPFLAPAGGAGLRSPVAGRPVAAVPGRFAAPSVVVAVARASAWRMRGRPVCR